MALKYCKEDGEEYVKRFKREVRLLEGFRGNSKVVDVLYSNTDNDPPYFLMKFYPQGDLTNIVNEIKIEISRQEDVFNSMIDCISELHSAGVYHRDIKPQNFLLNGEHIIVSDFGLGMEPNSLSRFTSSSMFWGTQGYLPPEFQSGGFKQADASSDIFMLGKSFYCLLTESDPTYLMDSRLHPAIYHVINRACALDKQKRYQTLSEMKQALKLAFDVVLKRGGQSGEANQLISTIEDRLENENKYSPEMVIEFINKLALVDNDDKLRICESLSGSFFSILPQDEVSSHIEDFLKVYKHFVSSCKYSFAFSEEIASNMKKIFSSAIVDNKVRAFALELAVDAARLMNRFAAMDTCVSMIRSVSDDDLGVRVVTVMQNNSSSFIARIEPSQCECDSIANFLRSLREM